MINVTDQLVIIPGHDLNSICRQVLDDVTAYTIRRYGNYVERDPVQIKQGNYAWQQLFIEKLPKDLGLGERFIQDIYHTVADGEDKGPQLADHLLKRLLDTAYQEASKRCLLTIRRGFKLVLLDLWFKGVITLPLTFLPGSMTAHGDFIEAFGTEVYQFFRSYETGGSPRPQGAASLSAANKEVLIKHAPRVILATNWHKFAEVSIDELSELHQAYLLSMAGKHTVKLPATPFPFQLMLSELLLHHGEALNYNEADRDLYERWTNYGKTSSAITKPPFREYRNAPGHYDDQRDQIKQDVIRAVEERRAARGRQKTADQRDEFIRASYGDDPANWPTGHDLRSATIRAATSTRTRAMAEKILAKVRLAPNAEVAHEAVIEYFEKIKGNDLRAGEDWLALPTPYPGRETVIDLPSASAIWRKVFNDWMSSPAFRRRKIDRKNARMAINFLADYLFLYLPWFKELYPASPVEVPLAPKDFRRVWFIDQRLTPKEEKLPQTLLQLLERRREAGSSQAALLYQLEELFQHIFRYYADDPKVAGPRFRNPIEREQDFPAPASGPNRSTKIAMDENVYPALVDFVYALEGFGQYLQELALRDDPFRTKASRQAALFDTAEWNYIPIVYVGGKAYPILFIPNIFSFKERVVRTQESDKTAWMPHLTILRCHIGNIETGQRIQNLRWLDIRTWDKLNRGMPSGQAYNKFSTDGPYMTRIYFGTDKSHGPYEIHAPFRVRACFLREQRFQESIAEPGMDGVSWYKFEENHPFGQIQPLFRSFLGPHPFDDNPMDEKWIRMWAGFEAFYNGAYDARYKLSKESEGYVQFVCTPAEKKQGTSLGGALGEGVLPPHDIKEIIANRCAGYLAIHTEHASRTTYRTIRNLGNDIMASQLAVSKPVARYYYAPTEQQMARKLEYADKVMHGAIPHEYQPEDPVNIRAQSEFGKIAQAISANPDAAIESLGFIPPIALWDTPDIDDPDWREMLRRGPISSLKAYATHICATGGECPEEILREFGERERCGACRCAMRCVDHLRAITGKIRTLEARIILIQERIRILREKGQDPRSIQIQSLHRRMCNDAVEREAWKLSEAHLLEIAERLHQGEDVSKFHSFSPAFIRRHVQSCTLPSTVNENLMLAMVDAQTFPELDFEELRVQAERWRRELNLEAGDIEAALESMPPGMEIDALMGMVKPMLELHDISPEMFAAMLSDPTETRRESGRVNIAGSSALAELPAPEEDKT